MLLKLQHLYLAGILLGIVFEMQQAVALRSRSKKTTYRKVKPRSNSRKVITRKTVTRKVAVASSYRKSKHHDCSCGMPNVISQEHSSRIVNGTPTAKNEFPWMVSLLQKNRHVCGGSLINDRYVLTAAHCLQNGHGKKLSEYKLVFGLHDHCNKTEKPMTRQIEDTFFFKYKPLTYENDLVLLKLSTDVPINVNAAIRPICLPPAKDDYQKNEVATVAGWGFLKENSNITSCELQRVDLPIIDPRACEKKFKFIAKELRQKSRICAGYNKGGKDTCQGDSGGPLMKSMDDGRYQVIGIVSSGLGCARPGQPGLYTSVSKHVKWIKDKTKDGRFCSP